MTAVRTPARSALRTLAALCAVALLGAPGVAARAGQPHEPDLRPALRQAVADGFPGAVAYARDGAREARAAAGVADTRTGAPARPQQRFRIASNTKAFVATVLLQLEGERRLSLDDSVEKWLPGLVQGHGNDGSAITVRQLLDHTAGLYDPTTEPAFWAPYLEDGDRDHVYAPREVVARAVRHAPTFPPGTGWAYSNTNYLVAGLVVEAVTGRSAGDEIQRRILDPLDLDRTALPTTDPDVPGPHLHGYDLKGADLTRFSPSYDWTAGAMISTVDDLARFQRALFGGKLLAPAQQRALLTPVDVPGAPAYGLGVQRREVPCPDGPVTVWGSDGAGPGYTSVAAATEDGRRQLVLAVTVFDIAAQLRGEPPVPRSKALARAQQAALCD
ncbi:serine hydrolase domain-containing protein [Streptomyces sp. Da 82-17]|uniref:serine hydrolase domain-containing protein n=1 Tax=Streptomyces sp. Da 82-17 TaxID=3377116 RepID=UPI0038D3B435